MGYIYLITNNVNGKKYVGQTIHSINIRWIQHKSEAKRGIPDVYFVRAMKKYGVENFSIQELEQCDNSLLDEREQYYIKLYNSNNNLKGYNSTIGGNSNNRKYEPELILSYWQQGFSAIEIAEKLSCCRQTIVTVLKENNISEFEIRSRGVKLNSRKNKKVVLQYDLTGELINIFSCVEEAADITGYGITGIREVCNHKISTAHGYIWCHEDEPKTIEELINELPKKKTQREIEQYDLNGNFIKKYDSIAEAAETLGLHRTSIENALTNKAFNCQGYLWKYVDDSEDILEKVKRNNNKKDYLKIGINQYTKDGVFIKHYDSAADAAKDLDKNGGGSSITKACKGKLKTAYGYKWSYDYES